MYISNGIAYSILFAVAQIIFVLFILGPHNFPDSGGYVSAANFILNGNEDILFFRLLRPLGPIFSALLTPFAGSAANGFLAENSIFLILASLLVFFISKEIYNDDKVAFFSSVIFSSSWVVLEYGLSVLTDMGVYFFILLDIYLVMLFFKKDLNYIFLSIIGLICGLGILMKENAIAGALFFVLMLIHSRNDLKRKINILLVFSLTFITPIIINSIIMYYFFNYTYLDWYLYNVGQYQAERNFTFLIYEFGFVFNVMLPFFMIGLYDHIKNNKNINIYVSFFISTTFPLLFWPALNDSRFVFVVFMVMIPLSSYGVKIFCDNISSSKITNRIIEIGCILSYIFANMLIKYALSFYGITEFVNKVYGLLP